MATKDRTTPDEFDEIAATLERFAAQYRKVGADMRAHAIEAIDMSGLSTLKQRVYPLVTGNITRANGAVVKAMFRKEGDKEVAAEVDQVLAKRQADAAKPSPPAKASRGRKKREES